MTRTRTRTSKLGSLLLATAFFALSLGALPPTALARRSLGMSAPQFVFSVQAGQGGQGKVVLSNEGDEQINVFVYAADQVVDDNGQLKFVIPNRENLDYVNSPASWIKFSMPKDSKAIGNTPYVTMKPGESVPIEFSFQSPSDATPGDKNAVMFFEMFNLSAPKVSGSNLAGRIGSRVKVRIAGDLISKFDILDFHAPQLVTDNRIPLTFTMSNGGNVDQRVDTTADLLGSGGKTVVSSVVSSNTPVYAGQTLKQAGVIAPEGLLVGYYTVRLNSQYVSGNGNPPQTISQDQQVLAAPLWLMVLTGGVIVLLVLWLVWRLAVGSARRRMVADQAKAAKDAAAAASPAPAVAPPADEPPAAAGE